MNHLDALSRVVEDRSEHVRALPLEECASCCGVTLTASDFALLQELGDPYILLERVTSSHLLISDDFARAGLEYALTQDAADCEVIYYELASLPTLNPDLQRRISELSHAPDVTTMLVRNAATPELLLQVLKGRIQAHTLETAALSQLLNPELEDFIITSKLFNTNSASALAANPLTSEEGLRRALARYPADVGLVLSLRDRLLGPELMTELVNALIQTETRAPVLAILRARPDYTSSLDMHPRFLVEHDLHAFNDLLEHEGLDFPTAHALALSWSGTREEFITSVRSFAPQRPQ